MGIRSFVPPVIIDAALLATRSRVGFTGYGTDFAAVAARCSGYEDAGVVASYRAAALTRFSGSGEVPAGAQDARSVRLVGATAAACLLAGRSMELSILDFGGAHGAHYDALRAVLGHRIARHVIVESPAVVEGLEDLEGQVLEWRAAPPDRLLDVVGLVDVAIASSTVQYLPSPTDAIAGLASIAPYVVLDRLPVVDHHEHFVMQQHTLYGGARVTYPAWFLSEAQLDRFFDDQGLRVISRWDVPEDAPMVLRRRRPNCGMLLETPLARSAARP